MKKRALFLSLLSLTFIAGCGENAFKGQEDKNSTEAQQFDRVADLNSGNYEAVLSDPNATASEYAAAALGQAGLDPVKLMDSITQITQDADAGTGTQNDIGAITEIIAIDPAALTYLQEAKDKLQQEIAATDPADPSYADLNFQLALTSLTSTVTALAQVGENSLGLGSFDASNGIDATEADALGQFLSNPANQNVTVTVDVNGDNIVNASDTLISLIANDVANLVDIAVNDRANLDDETTGTTNDINAVLTEVTQGTGSLNYDGSIDGIVSGTDISNYLTNVLGI